MGRTDLDFENVHFGGDSNVPDFQVPKFRISQNPDFPTSPNLDFPASQNLDFPTSTNPHGGRRAGGRGRTDGRIGPWKANSAENLCFHIVFHKVNSTTMSESRHSNATLGQEVLAGIFGDLHFGDCNVLDML